MYSYIELAHSCKKLNLARLNKMFEPYRQTFYPPYKTFAKKSILSANKFVTLQAVDVLYVRVETFAKQSVIGKPTSKERCF